MPKQACTAVQSCANSTRTSVWGVCRGFLGGEFPACAGLLGSAVNPASVSKQLTVNTTNSDYRKL
jgi:hypothetical protein